MTKVPIIQPIATYVTDKKSGTDLKSQECGSERSTLVS